MEAVVHAEGLGKRYVLELKPFALTATAKLGWAQLLATRLPAPPAAPSAGVG